MSRTRTLTNLIADVRQRTNMENSEFVTDAEITEYLNQELSELMARLSLIEGQPHVISTTTISVVTGTSLYSIPVDFWKVLRVVATIDGIVRDLHPFMEGERADLLNTQYFTASYSDGPRYRIQGDNIEILPATRSYSVEFRYTRSTPRLVSGTDTFDGFNGYEIAAIYGACASVRAKEESDVTFFESRKAVIFGQIDALASQRDASHPERVTDVTGDLFLIGSGW